MMSKHCEWCGVKTSLGKSLTVCGCVESYLCSICQSNFEQCAKCEKPTHWGDGTYDNGRFVCRWCDRRSNDPILWRIELRDALSLSPAEQAACSAIAERIYHRMHTEPRYERFYLRGRFYLLRQNEILTSAGELALWVYWIPQPKEIARMKRLLRRLERGHWIYRRAAVLGIINRDAEKGGEQ